MAELIIKITDAETGETQEIDNTDGFLLLYMGKDNRIKMTGKLDMKALAPILLKLAMEKIGK